jgi:hypothetical protein
MKKQISLNIAIAVALAATVMGVAASISRSASGPIMSNDGVATVPLQAPGFEVQKTYLLGAQNGRAFYRLITPDGACLGIAGSGSSDAGEIGCPLSDFSHGPMRLLIRVSSPTGSEPMASRVEGVAADGVASVEVQSGDGSLAGQAKVQGNLFSLPVNIPVAGSRVIARDSSGKVVQTETY